MMLRKKKDDDIMKLSILGAAGTVTGSKYLLQSGDANVMIDCGLFQGYKELRLRNWEKIPVDVSTLDAIVLTHAHIDHSGALPLIVKQGYTGPIYATEATIDLCKILLRDSGRIHEEDAMRANKYHYSKHHPALPLYTEEDAIEALKQFKPIKLGVGYTVNDSITYHASRAGHLLGSAILSFKGENRTIVFSGDLGRANDDLLKQRATIQYADYLVLESTYGNREHPEEDPVEELGRIIRDTAKRGGTVVIPSFAVGRTQLLLYYLYQLKEKKKIPNIPIILDSPMAQDATGIFEKHRMEHKIDPSVCSQVCKVARYTQSVADSKALHESAFPQVIIAASGMIEGGRVLHHIKKYAPDHHNTIVFSGFQAPMTRGEKILGGSKEVKIHGQNISIRARIESLESLSSHADYHEILEWLTGFKKAPAKVFLTHGEPDAARSLKEKIQQEFGWEVVIPEYLDEYEL